MTHFTSCLITSSDFLLVDRNCVKVASQNAPIITTLAPQMPAAKAAFSPAPRTQTRSEQVEKETEFIHICQRVVLACTSETVYALHRDSAHK